MATRSGGVSGVVYGLVTFVFLFVICLVLAILFYTQRNQALEEARSATEAREELIRSGDESNDTYLAVRERSGGRSVISQFLGERGTLINYLVGNPDASLASAREALEEVGILEQTGSDDDPTYALRDSAVARINALLSRVEAAEESLVEMEEAKSERDDELASLRDRLDEIREEYEGTLENLRTQLQERNDQFSAFEEQSEQARQDLIARREQFREEQQELEDELREQIAGLEQELNRREARINELLRVVRANQLSSPDMTLESDGRIVETNPSEGTVTITLGSEDNLILGMTFAVFDEETGVLTEVEQNGRTVHVDEKGIIEVIRFSEDGQTATARVVRQTFGQPLSSGDLISNIVYDKDRPFKFYVYGDFDLNNDNRATATERERVRNMIRTWGGELVRDEELPVDTDFVVLGKAPELPPEPSADAPEADWDDFRRKREQFEQYHEVLGTARDLGIPVLNQNRFLTLVGYYDN